MTNPSNAVTDGDMKDRHWQVRTDDEHDEMLDDLRRGEKKLPNRSEMIRLLVRRAYEAKNGKPKKPKS